MLHYLHQCNVLHVNLPFSHLLTIRVYPVPCFQLFLTCCFGEYIFSEPIVIFPFRYTSSHCIRKTTDVNQVTDLFFPPSLNVLVYAHVNVGVFTRTPFLPYPVWCHLTLQRMYGATKDAWLYFPGLKVGQNWSLFFFFFFKFLVALIINRSHGVRLFLSWLRLFSLSVFL